MALSNIFREPRREITESVMGFLVAVLPLYLDYRFAVWFAHPPIILGMIVGAAAFVFMCVVTAAFFIITHGVGEEICDYLSDRGLELRPKQRY